MKNDYLYLGHIRDAIKAITRYTADGEEAFFRDGKTQDAVVRNLEIIGEATKNMSESLKISHAEISWKDIMGMRDKVIHDYAGVDLKIVWDVVEKDLPPLLAVIEEMLKKWES